MTDSNVVFRVGDSTSLYQVQGGLQSLLSQGSFELCKNSSGEYQAKVGDVSWAVSTAMPCLSTDDFTYTFAVTTSEVEVTFYCVILQKEIGQKDIALIQAALWEATAYSGGSVNAEEAAEKPATTPTWDDGQEATGVESREASNTTPGPQSTSEGKITEGFRKGGMFLGASLRRAAEAASSSYSSAKAKAEASIPPETKAKIVAARAKLDAVGIAAGKAASSAYAEVKAAAGRLTERKDAGGGSNENEVGESVEDQRSMSSARRETLNQMYGEMRKAGENVVAAIMEAATRLRNRNTANNHAPSSRSSSAINVVASLVQPGHHPASDAHVIAATAGLQETNNSVLPVSTDSLPTSTASVAPSTGIEGLKLS
ncbi:hypothetical protein CEUSTIGMA_g6347.t1 [Chlamydomonas eustigma]|uniref:Senescence domain-containing protein n=1 Tax=Chlamydomonas eustigma TaxID=1157962 RepID=A0A250X751_9CHLO|nr:hypothetical protein CEUSTIGMA_g6347.t1 [Chlamydomonas eustigma]|eukprot:GAX78908.1 hypothetical protein CEUSTIGMA_g6347.t1 [Chlamydomonas eustigma]